MEKRWFVAAALGVCLFFGVGLDAGAQKKVSKKKQAAKTQEQEDLANAAEPDKMLYTRALEDMKHSRYTEGRLALQTLINTYPDSEYLAKAKLAIADSYFKEGGTSNLMQAIAEYKDFNTFFPFLDEAAYAQMQVGMAHYKMMEKADRDTAQAQLAEDELQAMLLKYPQSPQAPQAAQRLREVQEILADGEFRIGRYYYGKQDYHAAGARLIEVTERYPLYSQSDDALWMLGDIYTKTKLATKDEDIRNVWAAQAARCYARIASDYPLSKHAHEAQARLKAMGVPVPAPDPDALARLQKEQQQAKQHHSALSAFKNPAWGLFRTGPDVSTAAHSGQPNLNPPSDTVSATEVLKPASGGARVEGGTGQISGGVAAGSGPTTQVDAVPPGSSSASSSAGMHAGVQIITPGVNGDAAPAAPAPSTAASAPPADGATAPAAPPAGDSAAAGSAPAGPQGGSSSQTPESSSSGTTPSAAPGGKPAAAQGQGNTAGDDQQESTSKKKKGLRKLVPW